MSFLHNEQQNIARPFPALHLGTMEMDWENPMRMFGLSDPQSEDVDDSNDDLYAEDAKAGVRQPTTFTVSMN